MCLEMPGGTEPHHCRGDGFPKYEPSVILVG
jgi:hypothetical protein